MNYLIKMSLMAVVVPAIAMLSLAQDRASAMQKGVSVELAITHNGQAMPDADKNDALIVTITATGSLYSGIDAITSSALADRFKSELSNRENRTVYVKADARAPYARLVEVLDAARTAGVKALVLLTAQPNSSAPGTPEGLPLSLGPTN